MALVEHHPGYYVYQRLRQAYEEYRAQGGRSPWEHWRDFQERKRFRSAQDEYYKPRIREAEGRERPRSPVRRNLGPVMPSGSYQMSRRTVKQGRRLSYAKYVDRVSGQAIGHAVERYSKVSDPAASTGANRGAVFLFHGLLAEATSVRNSYNPTTFVTSEPNIVEFPIHCYRLASTRQNPLLSWGTPTITGAYYAKCGFKLIGIPSTSLVAGNREQLAWSDLGGWDRSTTIVPGSYPPANLFEWELEDNENTTNNNLGRKAMLEWTDMKLLFYGKKTRPTYIKCQLVTFAEPECCPSYEYDQRPDVSGNSQPAAWVMSDEAQEYWRARLKSLVANPCSSHQKLDRQTRVKVLSTKIIKLVPKESIDSDQDPHQQFIKWFRRWNRKFDFSYNRKTQITDAGVITDQVTLDEINDPQRYNSVQVGASRNPQDQYNVEPWLLISSYQPEKDDSGVPSNSTVASYDFNLRHSFAMQLL